MPQDPKVAAYFRYLKRTFEKASAAWRRDQRKNPGPCHICREPDAEITPEGVWLCREHKAQLKALQPYKSHITRLTEMKIPFLSQEDFLKGLEPPKKKRRVSTLEIKGSKEFQYSAGRAAPAKRAPARKKK